MGKPKPAKDNKSKKKAKSVLNHVLPSQHRPPSKKNQESDPEIDSILLVTAAAEHLQHSEVDKALELATRALQKVSKSDNHIAPLQALNLLGEIHVELGDIEAARAYFLRAAEIDVDGSINEANGGGGEKFLWLAQLSEEGGLDSVRWYEKGAKALRERIQEILDNPKLAASELGQEMLEEKRRKLATTLCGVVEVFMTDLSWEEDAEQRCEGLVTEATLVAGDAAEPWQTLASVRISQSRMDDAGQALKRSMEIWKDLQAEDRKVPDFPTRVSLARLLMETEMEDEAIEVLERLVGEDDTAVEVWYLGGWALYIVGEKFKEQGKAGDCKVTWLSSRQWLEQCLKLFEAQEYEDERLGQHATELVGLLDKELGGEMLVEGEWEDEEGSEDEEMVDV